MKDFYNFRNRNYLLRKLENNNRKEFVNIESYTIEHILPQNPALSKEWQDMLGASWKEIQKTYLHTIGNLTLTGYNSEYSDRPFQTKRDMKNEHGQSIGFKGSPIWLNQGLGDLEAWNETEIKKRAAGIADIALSVWEYPNLSAEVLAKYAPQDNHAGKAAYKIEDHKHLANGEPMYPVFQELRKRILNIDASVKEEPQKLYIAYKTITNFTDVIPQKNSLQLSLNIKFKDLIDPKQIAQDVEDKGRWGNGDVRIKLSSITEIDYAMDLIKQAFDSVSD